jgi:hypothetical protein
MGQFLTGETVAELVESANQLAVKLAEASARQAPPPPPVDFDGGAREPTPPPPVTHDEWLMRVIKGERPEQIRFSRKWGGG